MLSERSLPGKTTHWQFQPYDILRKSKTIETIKKIWEEGWRGDALYVSGFKSVACHSGSSTVTNISH